MSKIIEEITEYADGGLVFTVKELCDYLGAVDKEVDNVYTALSRLCERKQLYRYGQGIYGRMENGKVLTPYKDALTYIYTRNNNGYISGLDFCHMIGISAAGSETAVIVTNSVKKVRTTDTVTVKPPKIPVTAANKDYLQLLDFFENESALLVYSSVMNPEEVVLKYISDNDISMIKLIAYAKRYYNNKTFKNIITTIEMGYNILTKEQVQEQCDGNVYTLEEFCSLCDEGLINSSDGHGYFHDGIKETEADVFSNKIDSEYVWKNYLYVCWYNK